MDKLTPQQRHRCMAAIRSRDTKPELKVRRWLWSHGYRYRLNVKSVDGEEVLVEHPLHPTHRVLYSFRRQLALPHHDDVPTVLLQHLVVPLVAPHVPLYLAHPELAVRLGYLAARGTLNCKL